MSVKINENCNHLTDYAERLKEAQKICEAEKAQEANGDVNDAKASDNLSRQCDEYVSGEKSGEKPVGLYRIEQDKNGRKKIFFDDPNRLKKTDEQKQPKISGDNPGKSSEKCVANTDKVEREIRELKEKKQQLEQQLRQALGDERKARELEKKLAQVENELNQKDNDTYRRQNAFVDRVD